jgi:hypothetical protein
MSEVIGEFEIDPDELWDYEFRLGANDWATSTPYVIGNYVRAPTGWIYKCVEEHTSGTWATETTYWEQLKDESGVKSLMLLDDANSEIATGSPTIVFDPTGELAEQVTAAVVTDSGKAVTVYLDPSSAVSGNKYKVIMRVGTNAAVPRTIERTIKVKVKN